jgi:Carboxypeptidase regulatory-like domain/TonB-dependent Receptor Plug Domain
MATLRCRLCAAVTCSVIFGFAGLSPSARAQNITGTTLGTVKDQSNAVVADAQVALRNENSGLTRVTRTGADGTYLVTDLPIGPYEVKAEKPGFRPVIKSGIDIEVDARVTVDFTLEVGSVQQAVTVEGGAALVNLASGDVGQVLTANTIEKLPLSTRNLVDLIALTTGVTNGTPGENLQGGLPQSQPFGRTAFNINGLRTDANNFMMDGVDINDPVLSGLVVSPPLDAINEFKLEQNSYSAEFGRAAGGVVNLTMKSGGNRFHGELFEFARNKAFSARSFFDAQTPPFVQNQFGGIFSGPLIHDKLFFFSDYQGTRVRQGVTYIESVPTAAQRGGNLADQPQFYDPLNVSGTSSSGLPIRAAFPGQQIPTSRINPVAAKLMGALPLPNLPGTVNNYRASTSNSQDFDSGDIRVDAILPHSGNLFVRYSTANARIGTPAVFGILGGDPLLSGLSATQGQNIALGYTQVFSPTTLNELRIGFTRKGQVINNTSGGQDLSNEFGLPGFNLGTFFTAGLVNITNAGFSTIGSSPYSPDHIYDNIFDYADNVSIVRGQHSIKVGGSFIRRQDNHFEANYPGGDISFSTGFTNQPSASGVATGSNLASFLLGVPTGYSRDFPFGPWGLRSSEYAGFIDDLVRVSERFTLDLGLRYEVFTPLSEVHNRISNYNVPSGRLLLAGVETNAATINGDYNNLGPRVGYAYSLTSDKRTSVRGGFGMFYIPSKTQGGTAQRLVYNPPFAISQSVSFDGSRSPTYFLGQPILPPVVVDPNNPSGAVRLYEQNMRDSYALQYNIDLQRQLGQSWLIDAAYVGTRGVKLWNSFNINQAIPGPGPLASRYAISPNVTSITASQDLGSSNYNSLQLRLEKRFSSGLSFLAAYTFAKSIDSGGSSGSLGPGASPQDPQDLRAERGLSTFDVRHRFVYSGLYALPFGRGKTYLSSLNRWEDAALGGWQVNGILTLQSGLPFSPTINSNPANSNSAFNRPNRIGSGALPASERSIQDWFNVSAFTVPGLFQYGNSGRDILIGPGTINLDLSLFKTFTLTERFQLQFRAESFNLANHPNFANPATAIDAPGAGAITKTYNSGRELQLALKLFF